MRKRLVEMRLLLIALSVLMLGAPVLGQSGRKAPQAPKPSPAPSPTEPGLLQLKKSGKPSLPEIVDGERIYTSNQVDQRVRIRLKPNPRYSRDGQRRRTQGYVILRLILAGDQTVKHIEVVTGLPDGLTEQAIDAARRIKFTPAMKDGKPVSVWVELEYQFRIY